jgi:hypothetical protein
MELWRRSPWGTRIFQNHLYLNTGYNCAPHADLHPSNDHAHQHDFHFFGSYISFDIRKRCSHC